MKGCELKLTDAMNEFNKKFKSNTLNILNSHAGSGKTYFIFNEFLNNTYKYVDNMIENRAYINELNKVLYVCDTTMLKSSVLKETEDKCITKILEKGDLKRAIKDNTFQDILEGDVGYIPVITYSSLSFLLKNKVCKNIILKYFNCIIMDEVHNLFKYANRFDSKENKTYGRIIEYLPTLIKANLIIGISATPFKIYQSLELRDLPCMSWTTIFTQEELKSIKKYTNIKTRKFDSMINEIKFFGCIKKRVIEEKKYKILIYTNTVSCCEKYKKMLNGYGYNTEWLCSINNKEVDKETGEVKFTMSENQINLRNKLLEDGELPDDIDVLIINGAYETGWNLRDKKEQIQAIYVDDLDCDTQIQARNRVRHNIDIFGVKVKTNNEGIILDYDKYKNEYETDGVITYILAGYIEEKYIGTRLSAEDKKYLVNRYGVKWYDEKYITWNTFKRDLSSAGFTTITTKKGTFIYKEGEEPQIQQEVKKKMNNEDKLIDWVSNDWDKKRISIDDIKDILDIGTVTFSRLINKKSFVEFLKENRLKISSIKNGRVKYLYKY